MAQAVLEWVVLSPKVPARLTYQTSPQVGLRGSGGLYYGVPTPQQNVRGEASGRRTYDFLRKVTLFVVASLNSTDLPATRPFTFRWRRLRLHGSRQYLGSISRRGEDPTRATERVATNSAHNRYICLTHLVRLSNILTALPLEALCLR